MSILTKAKNMRVKKTEERSKDGNVTDRGYDTYKILNGIGLTVNILILSSILAVMINMNKTITTERIVIGQHEIRIDNHDVRLVRVEDKMNEFGVKLGEHAIKDAMYQNPFKGVSE